MSRNLLVPVLHVGTSVAGKVLETSNHSKLSDPNVQKGCLPQQFPYLKILPIRMMFQLTKEHLIIQVAQPYMSNIFSISKKTGNTIPIPK